MPRGRPGRVAAGARGPRAAIRAPRALENSPTGRVGDRSPSAAFLCGGRPDVGDARPFAGNLEGLERPAPARSAVRLGAGGRNSGARGRGRARVAASRAWRAWRRQGSCGSGAGGDGDGGGRRGGRASFERARACASRAGTGRRWGRWGPRRRGGWSVRRGALRSFRSPFSFRTRLGSAQLPIVAAYACVCSRARARARARVCSCACSRVWAFARADVCVAPPPSRLPGSILHFDSSATPALSG